MLVLARQLNERIIMPSLRTIIEVVGIKPNGVRLGIEAPPEITILREEVLKRGRIFASDLLASVESEPSARLARINQVLSNRLTNVALGLDLLRQQVSQSASAELDEMLQRLEDEVLRLDQQMRALLADAPREAAGGVSATSSVTSVSPCTVIDAEEGLAI